MAVGWVRGLQRGWDAERRRRLTWVLVVAGLLVAFALRVYRLGDQNIWWDEGLSVWATRKSFVETTLWTAADVHPPLYFWLLWPWTRLAGESEFSARFITVMESMLTVAVMFSFGRRLSGRRAVGVGALWLLALSRFHVWWSQEMRMYVLAGLCGMLSFYFLVRIVISPRSVRSWAAWVGVTLGALGTIYLSVLVLFLQNLFMLVVGWGRKDRWRFWRNWIAAQVVLMGLYAPWLALALPRMRSWGTSQPPFPLGGVLELNGVLLALGISTDVGQYRWAAIALMVIVGLGVLALIWQQRRGSRVPGRLPLSQGLLLLLCGVLLAPVMVWAATQPRSLFYAPAVEARYFLPWAPLFYGLLAWCLVGLLQSRWSRLLGVLFSLGVGVAFLWTLPAHYSDRYLRDDLQTLTRTIWTYAQPGDAVVLVAEDRYPLFLYYYDRSPAPADRPAVTFFPWFDSGAVDEETVEREMQAFTQDKTRIWLAKVQSHLQDPEGMIETWLDAHYARPFTFHFEHNGLALYATQPEEPLVPEKEISPQQEVQALLASGLEVQGFDLATREFRPGDTVRLALHLRAGQPLSFTVGMVHTSGLEVDRTGSAVPASDGPLRRQMEFDIHPYLPAGRYQFVLGDEAVPVGEIRVSHTLTPPAVEDISHSMQAQFGGQVQFLGYDLSGVVDGDPPILQPGGKLILDLYWQTQTDIAVDYHVFVHLLGSTTNPATGGPLWAQYDQVPLGGVYPTDRWLPGRPLQDRYELPLPPNMPAGAYRLVVGMYLLGSEERVVVSGDGADLVDRYLLLTPLQVILED